MQFGYLPRNHLPAAVGVQLWVLAVPQVHFELLLSTRIEAEVRLVREVVRVEQHFDKTRFWNERLGLLRLSTEEPRIFPVTYVCLGIAINNLKLNKTIN